MTQRLATQVCAAILVLYAAIIVTQTAHRQGWPGSGATVQKTSDYVSLWTAGKLALAGRPLAAYDWTQQRQEFRDLLGQPTADSYYLPFPYPPAFLGLMALFALLAYGTSHLVWMSVTYAAYAAAAARITKSAQGAVWMSAPIAVLYNADCGQTGALSAALLGLGLLYTPTRPVLAGVFFGALSYKPHLGVLIPLALAAAGYWRTFAAAAATAIALAAVATLAFGLDTWPAFLTQIGNMADHIHNASNPWKLQSLYGVARTLGAPGNAALLLHGLFCATIAVAITLLWRRAEVTYEVKAAALAAGAVLMSPYLFIYDLTVLMVAQAFLLRTAHEDGFDSREIMAIVAANILILVSPAIGLPTGFAAPVIILALAVRRMQPWPVKAQTGLIAKAA